jgi:SAM-dependent methyltransferase
MTDSWSERAQAYRESAAHREGFDLDLVVEWAEGAKTALDVATGGGHVARWLRDAGLQVVTTDAAPGMQPDLVSRAEELPFADDSFDIVTSRLGAHHFDDVQAGVSEMARVAADRVVVVDNLFGGEALEEAERVRDPSHVRSYSEREWRTMLEASGLEVADLRIFDFPVELQPWLDRAGCAGDSAEQVRRLAADRIAGGWITFERLAVKAVKR